MDHILREFLELVFPSNIYCICCEKPITRAEPYALCGDCRGLMLWANGRTCEKCGKILQDWHRTDTCLDCSKIRHEFERGFTCVQYGEREREIIHRMKYGKQGYIARKLAEIMADRICLENLEFQYIIPVPMYRKKERLRGYNQASLIAGSLSRRIGVPCERRLLVRSRDTEPMNQLSPGARRANMAEAFFVSDEAGGRIAGRTILLIDDVFTTGSTADACSTALLSKGAAKVYLLTFAAGANDRTN